MGETDHNDVQSDAAPETRSSPLYGLGGLAAALVHDLSGPIGVAAMLAESIDRNLRDTVSPEIAQKLDDLTRNLALVLSLIRDFRAGINGNVVEFESIDLGALVGDVVQSTQPAADMVGASLELSSCNEVIVVFGSDRQLSRALDNVIRNALEAVGNNGRVWVDVRRTSEHWSEIVVRDNGPGIVPGIDPLAAFHTSKEHGSGLGLTIVQHFLRAHGGSVAIESSITSGTVVRLELPLVSPE